MFDHDHGIAEVAEITKRLEQPFIVNAGEKGQPDRGRPARKGRRGPKPICVTRPMRWAFAADQAA